MNDTTVIELENPGEIDPLTELLRNGAKKLITEAIQAEVDDLMINFKDQKTMNGQQRIVRSGHHPEREILTGIGKVNVKVPKIRSREGEPESFQSLVVPPYIRRTATLDAAIPWLYLKGIISQWSDAKCPGSDCRTGGQGFISQRCQSIETAMGRRIQRLV